jgi:hypothetical protein
MVDDLLMGRCGRPVARDSDLATKALGEWAGEETGLQRVFLAKLLDRLHRLFLRVRDQCCFRSHSQRGDPILEIPTSAAAFDPTSLHEPVNDP